LGAAELKELAAAGELDPAHQVSRDGKSWTAAGLFSGLEFSLDTAIDRPFDIFISYSTRNAAEAQAVCTRLEQSGLRCWIAPRDLLPGAKWSEGVIDGLEQSRAMLVVLSREANDSPQVQREAERAISKARTVIFFPLDDVAPGGALKAALAQASWRDEGDLPLEKRVARLGKVVDRLLRKRGTAPPGPEPPPEPEDAHEERPAALVAMLSGAHAALLATTAATIVLMALVGWWVVGALTGTETPPGRASGEWSIEGDELVQSRRHGPGVIVFGHPDWSRYNLSFKAKAVGGNHTFSIFFHIADLSTYRKFQMGAFDNKWHVINSFVSNGYDSQFRKLKRGTIEPNVWYTVRIEVRGTQCRYLLGGVEWFALADPRFEKGQVGLVTESSQVRFREILITSEDGETVLWEGNPLL
jgi:hypothetical protein